MALVVTPRFGLNVPYTTYPPTFFTGAYPTVYTTGYNVPLYNAATPYLYNAYYPAFSYPFVTGGLCSSSVDCPLGTGCSPYRTCVAGLP